MRTRDEHLAWCKQRALEYLNQHDVRNAVCSMMSDMKEHPETPINDAIAALGIIIATNEDDYEARRWIEGFR